MLSNQVFRNSNVFRWEYIMNIAKSLEWAREFWLALALFSMVFPTRFTTRTSGSNTPWRSPWACHPSCHQSAHLLDSVKTNTCDKLIVISQKLTWSSKRGTSFLWGQRLQGLYESLVACGHFFHTWEEFNGELSQREEQWRSEMENTLAEASAKYLHSIISERRILSVSLTLSLESERGVEYDISNKRSAKQMTWCSWAR